MYTSNALLFPEDAIPVLEDKRGNQWQELIRHVTNLPPQHEERLAFMLFMMRFNGCIDCETDCYRAMRGCHACSLQSLRRFKGNDDELLAGYEEALADIRKFSKSNQKLRMVSEVIPFQHSLPFTNKSEEKSIIQDVALASI